MSITAQLHDGRTLEFPDGTDPSVVQATVRKVLAQSPSQQRPDEGFATKVLGGAVEPNLQMLTGMVAQPIAGLAGIAGSVLPGAEGQGADWVHKVQSALTYQPKTQAGKDASVAVGFLPEKLGELADYAGEKTSNVAGPAAGAVVNTAINAAPALLGMKGTSTLTDVAGAGSRRLMQSALKPNSAAVRSGSADRAIQTLLDEGINVTPGGAAKLGDRVMTLNDLIADAIKNSPARVDKMAVAGRLQALTQKAEKQVNPLSDMDAIQRAHDEFVQHPLLNGPDMPVQLAQEMKQGTYKQLRDKYGELGSADTEAQKGLARGLKEEIASAVPEISPLNARESDLLNAKDLLDHRVAVAGNKNPIGISHISPSVMRTVIGMLDRSELVKSLLARAMNPGNGTLPDMSAVAATAPQSFSEDAQKRQAIINALMGAR